MAIDINTMKNWFFLLFIFFSFCSKVFCLESSSTEKIRSAITGVDYILCIDGGGTKTTLHLLDKRGGLQKLSAKERVQDFIVAPPSNINNVGKEGVLEAFHQLFDYTKVGGIPLAKLRKRCAVIAGMAGLGTKLNRKKVEELLVGFGFLPEHIVAISDATLALEAIEENAVLLIAGTGSIVFGREGGKIKRAGGFGKHIGDEGGGYFVGKLALKAALEEEFGYGKKTHLTARIKEKFQIEKVYDIIPSLYIKITPEEIASLSKIVFDEAQAKDEVAKEIVGTAAEQLGILLRDMLVQLTSHDVKIYLTGGLFLAEDAQGFISQIEASSALVAHLTKSRQSIQIYNLAKEPIAALAVVNLEWSLLQGNFTSSLVEIPEN